MSPESIIQACSEHYGVSEEDMISESRKRAFVQARHMAMYLMTKHTGLTLREIGNLFCRDHTTVIATRDKMSNQASLYDHMRRDLEDVERMLELSRAMEYRAARQRARRFADEG